MSRRPAPAAHRKWRLASAPISWLTGALVVSSAAILYVGVHGVLETVGVVTE
ncbi:hypothetical protein [Streptomyces mutabilis]|uniref:hypothetical protein n=1 Tax=Streptomyces mutabilis TaxID=67332 RepID=UPI000B2E6246|nr:hypothetical protein [Streptomyces mutabilis]